MDELSEKLIAEYKITKVTDRNVTANSVTMSHKSFLKDIVGYSALLALGADPDSIIDEKKRPRLHSEIIGHVRRKMAQDGVRDTYSIPESDVDFDDYILMLDVKRGKYVFFSQNKKRVSEIEADSFLKALDKEGQAFYLESMRHCVSKYDPYTLEAYNMVPFDGGKVMCLNLYIPPSWRHEALPENPEFPHIFKKLFTHMFLGESLDYVLDWLYVSVYARNESFLVLNGAKGVGKGLFSEICKSVQGRSNSGDAPLAALTSQFMSTLENKRLLVFDENKVTKKEHSRLKKIINAFQAIEKKGIDVNGEIETFNSFILSNNDTSDMYLEFDDRRFSVVELNTEMLTESLNNSEIKELLETIKCEKTINAFAHYLTKRGIERKIDFDVFTSAPLKTARFYKLVYTSLTSWQRFLVDTLLESDQEEEELVDLRKAFTKEFKEAVFPKRFSKLDDFLTNYRHEGKHLLGKVCREGRGGMYIEVFKIEDTDCL